MPEYLAPGVYVEEVDTGAKPIEGVSTSTTGMVGVTERGPANVPVLVTSTGEFSRWFGGLLSDDPFGIHRYLPHAAEGFFTNGGKRLFAVRVLDPAATRAVGSLYDRGDATSITSTLLRAAGEGTGSGTAPPPIIILPVNGLAGGDDVRIGDGSRAEYRTASAAPVPETVMVPVDLPLARSHGAPENVDQFARATAEAYTVAPDNVVEPGDTSVVVRGAHADIATLLADTLSGPGNAVLELGAAGVAEYRVSRQVSQVTVVDATDSTARVRLDAPLTTAYAAGDDVTRVDLSGAVIQTAAVESGVAGEAMLWVDDRQGNLDDRADLVVIGADEQREVRRIGTLGELTGTPAPVDGLEAGSRIERVTFPDRTLAANAAASDTFIVLGAGEAAGLAAGQTLTLDPAGAADEVTVVTIRADGATVDVTPLPSAVASGSAVVPVAKETTADAPAGSRLLNLDDRLGVGDGTALRLGAAPTAQIVTVVSVPGSTGIAPDAGSVVVFPALAATVPDGTQLAVLTNAVRDPAAQTTTLVLPAAAGADGLVVSDATGLAAADELRITSPGGDVSYVTLTQPAAAVVPEMLTVTNALARAHPVGSGMVTRGPLLTIQALDAGGWGNRLRISVTDDAVGLVASTTLAAVVDPITIRLASRSGVEPGTVLEIRDPLTGNVIDEPVKVRAVDRTANNISLAAPGLSVPQRVVGNVVRSREFSIEVLLRRQPDPATPSRDGQVIDSERFQNLSMDPRHSRYVEKVIGAGVGPLRKWDRRTEGASLYIRVTDLAANPAAAEQVRLGPEPLLDQLPDGRWVPARHRLEEILGDDAISLLNSASYLGTDNADPELRTGLQSLRNIEDVSLVAIPGQFGAQVQQGLIDHCELMRYRFAVLDSRNEPADTIADVQDQRQQYDTKYAALYYPWLSVPDPFPDNPNDIRDYPLPPSGHVLGIYARTDVDRGVHKAPANEVVRGVTGLRRRINKEQQDLLNPSPVNVNVIRDFRDNNRGIRVYGGRVITSDPDWKYVNVRRLLIFFEASIERGLQWVVFEPNSEALWARVQRTITNFLTVAWRNGALEGTSPEEAFYVRCDRTTMTQTDIDNGRLIIQVGVAPVKPAEFVIVRIGLWTARADN